MDQQLVRIAQKIKSWRTEAGFSLQQLGDRCGVSPSTIHKIENGQSVPTIAVLLKLASGLGRRAGELVEDGPTPIEAAVTHEKDRNEVLTPQGTRIEWLVQGLPDPSLELWRINHPPGFDSETDHVPALSGEVVLVVEEGELVATIGDQQFRLEGGDSLHFKASAPYRWQNLSNRPARAMLLGQKSSRQATPRPPMMASISSHPTPVAG